MKTIESKTVKNISFDIEPKQYGKYNVLAYFTDKDKEDDINKIAILRLNTLKELKEVENILSAVDWTIDIGDIITSKEHYSAYCKVRDYY